MRLYLIPVKRVCNSDCVFCFMKQKVVNNLPEFINIENLEKVVQNLHYDEVEITGGGEPTLHKKINDIIQTVKKSNVKIKLYTNGFKLVDLKNVDELNISRISHISEVNTLFYKSNSQNDLIDTLKFYRDKVKFIRLQTILIKGGTDTEEKFLEMIEKTENLIDCYMYRTLFTKCDLQKDLFVEFNVNHKKAVKDLTLDNYTRKLLFINTDCVCHKEFRYD